MKKVTFVTLRCMKQSVSGCRGLQHNVRGHNLLTDWEPHPVANNIERETPVTEQPTGPQADDERRERRGVFKRLGMAIRRFFFPPGGAPLFRRLLPYLLLGVVTLLLLTGSAYAWEYTNSPVFCGETCHTMPPEYAAYQVSPHARVACVDCHIGRGFIAERITRKAGDIRHVTATLFTTYEYPIRAGNLRPARETCEKCHFPAKFSDDSLREIIHYTNDIDNTPLSTFLALRTGGGTERIGLGFGIHWHIENPVYYVATDELDQEIPYVRVVNRDGTETEFVAVDAEGGAEAYREMEQVRMDCISCHNRISHHIRPPDEAVDQALVRRQISDDIPYIRVNAVNTLLQGYETDQEALAAISSLVEYYSETYPEFYAENEGLVVEAVEVLQDIYRDTVFIDQQINWLTHPNNIGHEDWPGCFRCHDGSHVSEEGEAIRLECNLCHSIPEVAGPNVIEPTLRLATGNQPESHFSSLWIAEHRFALDQTCQACHTVENPGGVDNSSFCSNSACHGTAWEFAGLDAPELAQYFEPPTPEETEAEPVDEVPAEETPVAEAGEEPPTGPGAPAPGEPTWDDQVGPMMAENCTSCHNEAVATGNLSLETYNQAMRGGDSGPIILPGAAEESRLIVVQEEGHFATLGSEDLQIVIDWINRGAPQN